MTSNALAAWGEAWERLTPETIPALLALADPAILFRDPFQEIRGREGLDRMLRHMFATVAEPRFTVTDRAEGAEAGYLRWVFTIASGPVRRIEGVSEIRFGASGLVAAHLDHWDSGSQVYARLPLLGAVIRAVSRRLASR